MYTLNFHGDPPLCDAMPTCTIYSPLYLAMSKKHGVYIGRNRFGQTALQNAIKDCRGLEKILELLTNIDEADINAVDRNGYTALNLAVHHQESLKLVRTLLQHGASVNGAQRHAATPLHSSLECNGNVKIIHVLLQHGANVNAVNEKGDTPLHFAVRCRRSIEIITMLLQKGSDINAVNKNGATPLYFVLKSYRDVKLIRLFLQHAENKNGDSPMRCILRHIERSPRWPIFRKREMHSEYAKLLIKFLLIEDFDKYYRKTMNDIIHDHPSARKVSDYLCNCGCEIRRMKEDIVSDNYSLYDIVTSANIKTFHARNGEVITDQHIRTNYRIYQDVILPKVKLYLERARLLDDLSGLEIYSVMVISSQERKIILNIDCLYNIAKYLSNGNLSNLIAAFNKAVGNSSGSHFTLSR